MVEESRFTPANEFCPNPEYWHAPDSEATEEEVSEFIGGLVRLIQPEYVVETGTYHGHTAMAIIGALYDNGHGRLVTIEKDRAQHRIAEHYVQSFYSGLPNAVLLNMNSMDFIPEQDIDFAFFDSWQEGRAQEFLRFHDLGSLKKDAIVAFHDTAPHHQVWKYVWELEQWGLIKTINFHNPRGLTVAQVLK